MANDSERDALNEANLLGEESLGNFWPGSGLGVLMTLVDEAPEALFDHSGLLGLLEAIESSRKLPVNCKN